MFYDLFELAKISCLFYGLAICSRTGQCNGHSIRTAVVAFFHVFFSSFFSSPEYFRNVIVH